MAAPRIIETYFVPPPVYVPPHFDVMAPSRPNGTSLILTDMFDFSSIRQKISARKTPDQFDVLS